MKTVSRRTALGLLCSCCLPTFARQSFGEEDDFICSTPQFEPYFDEILDNQIVNFSAGADGQVAVNAGSEEISITDFANAVGSKIWRRSHSENPATNSERIRLGVVFLNGSASEQNSVKKIASEWSKHIPIDLVYDTPKHRRIRIMFGAKTNQSAIGTNALSYDAGKPTMTFSAVNQRSVLHEFGHALVALRHEHKHPDNQLDWNVSVIAKDLGWTEQSVRSNFLGVLSRTYSCRGGGTYDPKSIMHYPIRKTWTKQGVVVSASSSLSSNDILCAKTLYSGS